MLSITSGEGEYSRAWPSLSERYNRSTPQSSKKIIGQRNN